MNSQEELIKIDEALTRIRSEFEDYSHIAPTNIDEEYEKFVKNNYNYDPQLIYKPYSTTELIKELEELKIDEDSPEGILFSKTRNYLIKYAIQLNNIGTNKFHTEHLFEPIDKESFDEATKILSGEVEEIDPTEKVYSSKELGIKLNNVLEKYGLKNWNIDYQENMSSSVSINGGLKKIKIRKNKFFTEKHLKKLIVHEIETHALRSENGRGQKYKIFSIGLPQYLSTEEGLASYNEETQEVSNPAIIKRLARNLIVTKIAAESGFMKVYTELRKHYKEGEEENNKAFKMAIRIKRGLGDTSQSGGFLKDHAYFQGYIRIKKYVESGGDIKKLYAGKIGLQDLHILDEGIICYPKILPDFLK